MPAISLPDYLAKVLAELQRQYQALSLMFPAPKMVDLGGLVVPRYAEHTDTLLCFLKGVKVISTLNGALALLRVGHAQEMNVLIRVADDCCGDIISCSCPKMGSSQTHNKKNSSLIFFKKNSPIIQMYLALAKSETWYHDGRFTHLLLD